MDKLLASIRLEYGEEIYKGLGCKTIKNKN